jgi:hypothetical protein
VLSEPQNHPFSPDQQPRSGLDLIFGHLTDTPTYVPVSRPSYLSQLRGWYRPSLGLTSAQYHHVVTIQRFKSGGYEAIARPIELEEMARKIDAPRHTGKREKPENPDPESSERAEKRAKKRVRHLIKSMGADRLATLTRRESDPSRFWSREDWVNAWDRFVRLCKRADIDLAYVAVLELHKKGNFHLHVALVGRLNVNIARRLWWIVCGGRGQGNIDIRQKKNQTDFERRAGLAKYVSKYLTKGFGSIDAFNKKRYFASRHDLPDIQRIIFNSVDWVDALAELCSVLGLNFERVLASRCFYKFPAKDGFWLNFTEDIANECPF